MPLWGNRDQYSDAPKFVTSADSGNTGQEQFGNTVYLADATEVGVTKGIDQSGWVKRTVGVGPVASITINAGGTGYSNADTIKVSGGTVNAAANLTTNSTGGITGTSITNFGAGFANGAATLAITTSGGSTANLTPVLGGRANRTSYEVLATIKTVIGDAVSFSNTSTANVANSSGSADDTVLPDA